MRKSPVWSIALCMRAGVPGFIVAVLLMGMAACGSTVHATVPAATASQTSVAAVSNGCLEQPGQATMPTTAADVVLTQRDPAGTSFVQAVTVYVGQVIEVRLPINVHWTLAPYSSTSLAATPPQSLLDSVAQVCVWRFVAQQIGMSPLNFSGGLVCAPNQACPAIAEIKQYAITVLAQR